VETVPANAATSAFGIGMGIVAIAEATMPLRQQGVGGSAL